MGHHVKPGVATGKEVQAIFNLAKEKSFALPAVNVVGSNTINAVLETARDLNAPVHLSVSPPRLVRLPPPCVRIAHVWGCLIFTR